VCRYDNVDTTIVPIRSDSFDIIRDIRLVRVDQSLWHWLSEDKHSAILFLHKIDGAKERSKIISAILAPPWVETLY